MKCKKCGYRAKDINGMRKHYMKAHPGAMKHHGPRKARESSSAGYAKLYCGDCGSVNIIVKRM